MRNSPAAPRVEPPQRAAPSPAAPAAPFARNVPPPAQSRGRPQPQTQQQQKSPLQPQVQPITTEAEARAVTAEIEKLMTELCGIVEEETALVRGGRLTTAAKVAQRKTELARAFMDHAARLRASTRFLAAATPNLLDTLRQQHEQFRARLQINLTVLATARAVSEGILRGVATELQKRSTPTTYGSTGRAYAPPRRAAAPIAVSRSL